MRHLAPFLALLLGLSCGKNLEQQIQRQVATFETAALNDAQVQVSEIRTMGDEAVAEIQIHTAVRLTKRGTGWEIDEFRIGDRRWEKASHILELINARRSETTLEQLRIIEQGIGEFRSRNGGVPQVSDFGQLMDLLTPEFQGTVVRLDAWSNPFHYRATGELSYDLISAGPDGARGTPDDLRSAR